jgi:hypothetical protein
MPDVGLTTATEPLSPKLKVIIKYSIEVEGLPVYNESYDVAKLAQELKEDETRTLELWARRLRCAVECRDQPGFSSSLTRCLADGKCCDYGTENCRAVDEAGLASGGG